MFQSTFNTLLGSLAGLRAFSTLGKPKEQTDAVPDLIDEEDEEDEDLYDEAETEVETETPEQLATARAYSQLKADVQKQKAQQEAIKQRRDMLYQEADEGPDLGAALRTKLKGGK